MVYMRTFGVYSWSMLPINMAYMDPMGKTSPFHIIEPLPLNCCYGFRWLGKKCTTERMREKLQSWGHRFQLVQP